MNQASGEPALEGRAGAGECKVMKFGGTSVQGAAAIQRLCHLVRRSLAHHPVVVVSALARVTDQLMNVGWAAAERRMDDARSTLQLLRDRHETVAAELLNGDERARLRASSSRSSSLSRNLKRDH